jgi:hypothetical protein
VSYGQSRVYDPQGEARAVLQSAVKDFGERVLSNPALLEGVCEDRLPELPREASLIASAARADVAGMLQQQVSGVGPASAVRLTASALADSQSLDPAACAWVVREFARALGYPVAGGSGADAAGAAAQQWGGASSPPAGGAAPPLPTMPAYGASGQPPPAGGFHQQPGPAPGPGGWGGNAGFQPNPWQVPPPAPQAGGYGGALAAAGRRPARRGLSWPVWGLIGSLGAFVLGIVISVAGSAGTHGAATPATVTGALLGMAGMLAVPVFLIAAIVRWIRRRRAAVRPPGM